jgi:predicted secreted protein
MDEIVQDQRSGRVIFLSHCFLNQNAKVRGIAKYPGVHKPLIDLLTQHDVGIFQMPCPEMSYLGPMRWGYVKDQYNTPMFRRHCEKIAQQVLDQAVEYRRAHYELVSFIMVDGSPVCGLNRTAQPIQETDQWGGMVWYIPEQHFAPERGVFCEILQAMIQKQGLSDIPFVGLPEVDEAGSLVKGMEKIQSIL